MGPWANDGFSFAQTPDLRSLQGLGKILLRLTLSCLLGLAMGKARSVGGHVLLAKSQFLGNFANFWVTTCYNHGSPWFYLILRCKPWFLQQTQFRGLPFPFSRPPSAGTVLGTRSTWAPTSLTPQAPCRASVSWLHQGQSNGQLQLLCMRHIYIYIYIYIFIYIYMNSIKSD